jgi:hypothetical protein
VRRRLRRRARLSVTWGERDRDADERGGTFAITDEQLRDFEEGRSCVNLHTEQDPEGALRGQLERDRE